MPIQAESPSMEKSSRPCVLIVDDSVEHTLLLHNLLREEYVTMVAPNGTRALELASASPPPDLVLLDVVMPGPDGYDTCRRLKQSTATADIPVIFITGHTSDLDEEQGLSVGGADYITKPFAPAVVRARLRTHLALKETNDRLRRQSSLMEEEVRRRTAQLLKGNDLTLRAIASIVEARDNESGAHILRTQHTLRALAESLRGTRMRVLVIEDNPSFAELMQQVLTEEGYTVDVAPGGAEGRALALGNQYDAIVLDLELPDYNGLSLLQDLRREGSSTPIVVATVHDTDQEVVRALDAGADDYLQKPFANEVLAARVRAAIRRGGARSLEKVQVGDLTLHRVDHEVYCHGKPVILTSRQYALLEYLAMRAGDTVTRPILLEHVWNLHSDPASNVLDVHVAQLRKRLRDAESEVDIRTVRGEGYVLEVA
jgi:DNA-binding response OmpR family regulator